MIACVTSFRALALAQDWGYHVWLLERTVRSMLAQTRGEIYVVVACHEIPDTPLAREPRVHFLTVNAAPPARNNDDMCVDKVLKLTAGSQWALAHGCDYVVFNDADDLVSNRIGGFVADHHGENGWYCSSQLFYTYGGRLMRRVDVQGSGVGPCVIVRADLLTFAAPPFSGAWVDLVLAGEESNYLRMLGRHGERVNELAAVGLGHYPEFMTSQGHALKPLPFPANVVINHPDSTSFVAGGVGSYHHVRFAQHTALRRFLCWAKQRIAWLPTLRLATRSLRREFLIPPEGDIPRRYRTGGSLFWR